MDESESVKRGKSFQKICSQVSSFKMMLSCQELTEDDVDVVVVDDDDDNGEGGGQSRGR